MNLVFQPSRNVPLTPSCVLCPPTLPVCEWFQRSLHLLLLFGMFLLALLCTMVTRVTSSFLAGQEDGRKRRETMTPTNQGAGYSHSYHLMNEVLGVGVSLTLSAVNKTTFLLQTDRYSEVKLIIILLSDAHLHCTSAWGGKHNI